MADLASLIAEVLREHRPTGNWRSSLGHECLCRHWEKGDITDDEPLIGHTAELLASRLNLHEERRPIIEPKWLDWRTRIVGTETRLVSGWTEEQQ